MITHITCVISLQSKSASEGHFRTCSFERPPTLMAVCGDGLHVQNTGCDRRPSELILAQATPDCHEAAMRTQRIMSLPSGRAFQFETLDVRHAAVTPVQR